MLLRKFLKNFLIFSLIIAWIFSGWPQIWNNPRIPPEVEESRAASPETFTSSGTFTASTGIYAVDAQCWGGGGAGGGTDATTAGGGGGGGGGGSSKKANISVTPSTGYTVAVGARDVSSTTVEVDGKVGGDSAFIASTTVLAKGGSGGKSQHNGATGGAGGATSTAVGDASTLYAGGSGYTPSSNGGGGGSSAGTASNGRTATSSSGAGQPEGGGPGGNGGGNHAVGSAPASGPGGGGGGAGHSNSAGTVKAGGAGYAGQCIITYTDTWTPSTALTTYSNTWTFATAPNNDADGQITMDATPGYDYNTISYSFAFTACASNGGTGGTNSGWQSADTTYTDIGLDPNKCYGYTIQTKDSLGNTGTASVASETYSSANIPGQPTLTEAAPTTLKLTNDANGNPLADPATTYAVQVVTGDAGWVTNWVNGSGEPVGAEVWLTDEQLDALVLGSGGTPLTSGTTYGVKIKAKNQNNDETDLSSEGQGATLLPLTVSSVNLLPSPITANENSVVTATCTATIIDGGGGAEITSATGTIYRSGVTSSCSANNENCYQDISCSLSAPDGNNKYATCTTDIWFYADPTDAGTYSSETWQCYVIARNNSADTASSTDSDPPELNTLSAVMITPSSIDYGLLTVGATSSASQTMFATNTGNIALNLLASSTDFILAGGATTIAGDKQAYSLNDVAYESMTACATTSYNTIEAVLAKPAASPSDSIDIIYWKMGIPEGQALGTYNATTTIVATPDS